MGKGTCPGRGRDGRVQADGIGARRTGPREGWRGVEKMSWRFREQGIETLTLEIQPALCPVCRKVLYRNITFLTGGWARCSICTEVIHYTCLSGGIIFKKRPRVCRDCKAGRVREGQTMPVPPSAPVAALEPAAQPVAVTASSSASQADTSSP